MKVKEEYGSLLLEIGKLGLAGEALDFTTDYYYEDDNDYD